MMKILIGSPSADGEVEYEFATAVMALIGHFLRADPKVSFEMAMPEGRSISTSRDILANRVLRDESYSHLLFIDTDMGFRPELIERMLATKLPVIGTIAPQRHRDLDAWVAHSRTYASAPLIAELAAASYTPSLAMLALDTMDQTDDAAMSGLIAANQTGAGILLIRRDCLETMALYWPELHEYEPRPDMQAIGLAEPLVRFFAPLYGPEGVLLGEDISFTYRWTDRCGGSIWVTPDALITHAGTRIVTGNYQRKLELLGEI
jgi:hypothetical protein